VHTRALLVLTLTRTRAAYVGLRLQRHHAVQLCHGQELASRVMVGTPGEAGLPALSRWLQSRVQQAAVTGAAAGRQTSSRSHQV
jgi:hypothetical protein